MPKVANYQIATKNIYFRVTLKKLYSIIKIPKFEAIQADQPTSNDIEESVTIRWQQKVFSKTELIYYGEKDNCKSELEKRYHQMISNEPREAGLIFTYTNVDNYHPPDGFGPTNVKLTKLRANVELKEKSDEGHSIFVHQSQLTIPSRYESGDEFERMFIMADLEPITLLFIIQYRKSDGLFTIFPDFNDMENGYFLEIDVNSKRMFCFCVENLSLTSDARTMELEQKQQLDKIQEETQKLIKKLNLNRGFDFQSTKFFRMVLMIEILDGWDFEFDNIHVQYRIKVPSFMKIIDGNLEGSTHSSFKSEDKWNFGFCHSIILDIDDEFTISKNEIDLIVINFEVISMDPLWNRERREGLASIKLPLECKSCQTVELKCFRDLQGGSWMMDFLERFFLGGIHKAKFLDHQQEDIHNFYGNPTVSTGTIRAKIQQIKQVKPSLRNNLQMKSIDEIINSYHKAKSRLNL